MDELIDRLNDIMARAAQTWVKDFEQQHPRLIALLDGVKTEEEALGRLSGLTLKELLLL